MCPVCYVSHILLVRVLCLPSSVTCFIRNKSLFGLVLRFLDISYAPDVYKSGCYYTVLTLLSEYYFGRLPWKLLVFSYTTFVFSIYFNLDIIGASP